MASSFVSVGEHGFWMTDSLLRLWLRLAALQIASSPDANAAEASVRDRWLVQSQLDFVGCIYADLDTVVADPDCERPIKAAIEALLRALRQADVPMHAETLNLLGFDGLAFGAAIDRRDLIETSEMVLRLMAGEVQTTAADSVYVPGARTKSNGGN